MVRDLNSFKGGDEMSKKEWQSPELYNLSVKDTEATFGWTTGGVNSTGKGLGLLDDIVMNCRPSGGKPGGGVGPKPPKPSKHCGKRGRGFFVWIFSFFR